MDTQTIRRPGAAQIPGGSEPFAASAGLAASPADAERAGRAAARDRLAAFISGGTDATSRCGDVNDDRYDYDHCRAQEPVGAASLFVKQNGDASAVDLRDVTQASLGNCYFMSSLGAISSSPKGRELIQNAIVENKNDRGAVVSYTVTLYKPQTHWLGLGPTTFTKVAVTVDAKFAQEAAVPRGDGTAREVWPLVMEKAYAQLRGGYNAIGHGGRPCDAMAAITGHPASRTALGLFGSYHAADLTRDLAAGRLVVLGSRGDSEPYHLRASHSYVVTGARTVGGTLCVMLHNPWNIDEEEPKPVPVDKIAALFHSVDVGSL
jgi:Calpain family cysteine protease